MTIARGDIVIIDYPSMWCHGRKAVVEVEKHVLFDDLQVVGLKVLDRPEEGVSLLWLPPDKVRKQA